MDPDMFMGVYMHYGVDVKFLWWETKTTGMFVLALIIFVLVNVGSTLLKHYRQRFLDRIIGKPFKKTICASAYWISFLMTLAIYSILCASMLILMSFNVWVIFVFVIYKYGDILTHEYNKNGSDTLF